MRLICIGDSITFGYGISSSVRWTNLVADKTKMDVVNCGINGDTTAGMLVRLHDILKGDVSDSVIMLMGGVNDIFFAENVSIPKANFAAMVKQAQEKGAIVLAGIMMPIVPKMCYLHWDSFDNYEKADKLLHEFNEWLRGYCECFGVEYFELNTAIPSNEAEELLLDGLHPNEKGHEKIAEKLIAKLNTLKLISV